MTTPTRPRGMTANRLEAFSDGVFAIAITLLVLELHVPASDEAGHFGTALRHEWPSYLAYLASFFVIGIIWLNHHATIALVHRVTHPIQVLNLGLLLTVSVLPFPTELLAEATSDGHRSDQRVACVIYGLLNALMAVTFNLMFRYIRNHPELQKEHVSQELIQVRYKRFNLGLPAYPIATVVGLFSTTLFFVVIFGLAILYLLPTPDQDFA